MMEIFRTYHVGNTRMVFFRKGECLVFTPVPEELFSRIAVFRRTLPHSETNLSYIKRFGEIDPLSPYHMVQFKLRGDVPSAQHFPGRSMRNSSSVGLLELESQSMESDEIKTVFRHPSGLRFVHHIDFSHSSAAPTVFVSVENRGEKQAVLEYLAGCSLGQLSPFQSDDAPEKYRIHRLLSAWSAEGRHEVSTVEELHLEISWQAAGLRNFRFGENGSMPVRGAFPFLAFEDSENQVFWGVKPEAAGSWELELSRTGDRLELSGGYPGTEGAGWSKALSPGESYESMKMRIACVAGTFDDLCCVFADASAQQSPQEKTPPVFFNEWCTTWGRPSPDTLEPVADAAANFGCRYFVIDAGWFRDDRGKLCIGDWEINENVWRGSFASFIDSLRRRGMIPGIWFEFETCYASSQTAVQHPSWLLRQDGCPVASGPRRFLDFRNPEVIEHLHKKVTAFLQRHHFGYLKLDYNATTAGQCDGSESPSENHRLHIEAVLNFCRGLKKEIPDLVLEICSSGGFRLTEAWDEIADQISISDLHESAELPLVAANARRLASAWKSQIWVTLREYADENRFFYLLCGGMLGSLCLSGDIDRLSETQRDLVHKGLKFYRNMGELLYSGKFRLLRSWNDSLAHPCGWQAGITSGESGTLVVIHSFGGSTPEIILPGLKGNITDSFMPRPAGITRSGNSLLINGLPPFSAAAILLE